MDPTRQAAPNMLALAPRWLPPLSAMLSDLGHPSPASLCTLLDVTPRTLRRWVAADAAPKAAALALFWLTRWGRSAVECQAVNDARLSAALAASAQRLAEQRAAEVDHLLQVGDFGAANAPLQAGNRD